MANEEHLAILKKGIPAWNGWIERQRQVEMFKTDLWWPTVADLSGADLSGARLACADFHSVDLSGAKLTGASLHGAELWRANLSSTLAIQAGKQAAWVSRSSRARGILATSPCSGKDEKVAEVQSRYRTAASASLKLGRGLGYQAARRGETPPSSTSSAHSVTSEKRPSSAGVVRAIARSDHCRCVSTPRCRRTSANVTSTDQRRTNQRSTSSGSASGSVHRKPCGSNSPAASRTRSQRTGTRLPGWYQSAVPEIRSIRRSVRPYQPATVTRRQRVFGSARRSARVG